MKDFGVRYIIVKVAAESRGVNRSFADTVEDALIEHKDVFEGSMAPRRVFKDVAVLHEYMGYEGDIIEEYLTERFN